MCHQIGNMACYCSLCVYVSNENDSFCFCFWVKSDKSGLRSPIIQKNVSATTAIVEGVFFCCCLGAECMGRIISKSGQIDVGK